MKSLLPCAILLCGLMLPMSDLHAQNQHEMNQQAFEDFQKADAELNKTYNRLLAKLDDIGKQKLRAAQRAWVAFRDAQAEFEADDMRDGSAAPLLHSGSRARNTRDRTAALKEHLKELESR